MGDGHRDDLGTQDTLDVQIDLGLPANVPKEMQLQNVLQEIGWAKNFFSKRDSEMKKQWRFYHKQHYDTIDTSTVEVPGRDIESEAPLDTMENDDEWAITLNIPTNTIDMAKLMLTGEQPVIDVIHKSSRTEKRATKVLHLLYGTYHINNVRRGRDLLADLAFNMLLYGWGVVKSWWNETRLPAEKRIGATLFDNSPYLDTEEEMDEENFIDQPDEEFPVELSVPFPMTIYGIPGGRDEPYRAMFQSINIDWMTLLEQLPPQFHRRLPLSRVVTDLDGKEKQIPYGPGDMVNYVDFWREVIVQERTTGMYRKQVWHAILVEDKFVKPPTYMPEYEFIPYTVGYCINDTDPENGENMGHPFMYKVLDAVKNLELDVSRAQRALEMYADPVVIVESNDESPPRFSKLSGAINFIKAGESVRYLQWNGSPPDVRMMLDFHQNQVMEMAFPGPGIGVFGGKSGIDTLAQQRAALSKIMEPKSNMEMLLDRVNTKIISLVQRFAPDTPISVRGQLETDDGVEPFSYTIRGRDTRGLRYTQTTLRARFPMDELQNAATVGSMLAQKAYSREAAMKKFYFVRDTKKMLKEIRTDEAASHPGWVGFFQQILQTKFQEMQERRAAARAQERAAGSTPGPAEGPVAPPVGGGELAGPGRPPLPTLPPGGAGGGLPGSLEGALQQGIGDLAAPGAPPGPTSPRGAVLPPRTQGEGTAGLIRSIRERTGG